MNNPLLSLAAFVSRLLPVRVKQLIYEAPPVARFLRRALNRAAPIGLTRVTVAAGGLRGAELLLDLQAEKDYWLGTYEPGLDLAIRELVPPGSVAYDLGANIGYLTILLARQVGEAGRVYAFEALPDNVRRLNENLALNHLHARVQVRFGAVVDCSGPTQFLVGPSGGVGKAAASAGREAMQYSREIEVPGIALDDFVYQEGYPPPGVMKIDIEGGEVLALPGMHRVLAEARPLIFLEIHGPKAAEAVWEHLQRHHYALYELAPGHKEIPGPQALGWKAYLIGRPQS